MERLPPKLNERPPKWVGRNDLETLLASTDYKDWIKITEMFLGKQQMIFNSLLNIKVTPMKINNTANSYE